MRNAERGARNRRPALRFRVFISQVHARSRAGLEGLGVIPYLTAMPRSTTQGLRLGALLSLAACGGSHTAPLPAPTAAPRTAPRLVAALHAVRVNETLLNYRLVGDQGKIGRASSRERV